MNIAIKADSLWKRYRQRDAVRGISLRVSQGEVCGFVGPNGAGKSTTIKMLLDLVRPTSGHAYLFDQPAEEPSSRSLVGFMPEHFRFYDWMSAKELLRFYGRLHGVQDDQLEPRLARLLERVGLSDRANHVLRTYSKGMLQRLGLAQSLVSNPHLLILDEPTSGMDPSGRQLVLDVVREQRALGTTVFYSSHVLSDLEQTCDRVIVIKSGQIVRHAALHSTDSENKLEVEIAVSPISQSCLLSIQTSFPNLRYDCGVIRCSIVAASIPVLVRELSVAGADIYSVVHRHTTLEEHYFEACGESNQ